MYCYSCENYQNLIDLLHTKKCTLSEVIEDPGFATALRNDSPDLINFLTQEAELQTIIEYALSGDIEETVDPIEYKKMMRHSMIILTSSSRKLQNFLIENDRFMQYLHAFPSSKAINSSMLCANYAKIIDFLISNSQRKFLDADYSNLINTLIEHIDNLSFQMLFVKICCDYLDNFNMSYSIMKKLLDCPKDISKIYTLTKIVNDKSSLIKTLNKPEFLIPLYEIVVRTYKNEHLLCSETCNLLLIIIKSAQSSSNSEFFEYCENEYGRKIDYSQPLNYSSAAVLSLFPKYVDNFIERFFLNQDQCTTQVNQSIVDALRKKKKNELQEIAIKYKIFSKIMDSYPLYLEHKVNGHYFQIIQLFISNQIQCIDQDKEKWASFIQQEKFIERYQNIFGGKSLREFLLHLSEPTIKENSSNFNIHNTQTRFKIYKAHASPPSNQNNWPQVFKIDIELKCTSSFIPIPPSSMDDNTIINQPRLQTASNTIKIEDDAERKLMTQSLDANTMKYVKSKFIIKKEPRNH